MPTNKLLGLHIQRGINLKSLISLLAIFALISCSTNENKVSSGPKNEKQTDKADSLLADLAPEKVKACLSLASMARSAIFNREKGVSKESLLAPLPTKEQLNSYPKNMDVQKMMGLTMHEIVSEVYNYQPLESEIYSSYTAEVCLRKLKNTAVPESFTEAHKELQECEVEETEKKRILCAMAVAGSKP